jgi:hypothetical protein
MGHDAVTSSHLHHVDRRWVWGRLLLDEEALHLRYVGGCNGRRRIALAEIQSVAWSSEDYRRNLTLYLTNGTLCVLGVSGAGLLKYQLDERLRRLPVRITRLIGRRKPGK